MIDIHNTEWALGIKQFCNNYYDTFIEIATNEYLQVNIYYVDTVGWVIEPRNILPDFWLDICFTKQQAVDLCNKMEWSIR